MRNCIFIIIVSILNFNLGFAQLIDIRQTSDDSKFIATACDTLTRKFGIGFVKDSIVCQGIFKTVGVCLIQFQFIKESNKNMFCGFIIDNDSQTKFLTEIRRSDIEKFFKGNTSYNVLFNKSYAIELAKGIKFEKGINDWRFEFDGVLKDFFWMIYSTRMIDKEHPVNRSGKCLKINARTGEYSICDWISGE